METTFIMSILKKFKLTFVPFGVFDVRSIANNIQRATYIVQIFGAV